jgi:putative multiple sugar transport system permease protein
MAFIDDLRKLLRENIREYGMFIALFVIFLVFTITTDGLFISSRNLVNLVNQTGYIAVLAVGMTLVIVIRHIDLSVGFLAGFLGAVAAIAMADWGLPVYVVIPLVLILGIIAGLITSFMVANLGIPAFVATLAGWLGYRGALQLATRATGTIIIKDEAFNAIGNGFVRDIPDIGILPEVHKLTLILGFLGVVLFLSSEIFNRINNEEERNPSLVDRDVHPQIAFHISINRWYCLDISRISGSFMDRSSCIDRGNFL